MTEIQTTEPELTSYLDAPLGDPRESWYRPMGLRLRLVTDSPEVQEAAQGAFAAFGAGWPESESDLAPDLTLRLFAHDETDDDLAARPVLRVDGPLLYQTVGRGSTLVVDQAAGRGFGYFSPAVLANRGFFRWHFLDLALFFLLEGRGFLGIHGAALARDGRALVLRAPSGTGKSTLTYAASRGGRFQALAEDLVWLAPDDSALWGMPWTFHLLPDAMDLFPELAGRALEVCHNGEIKMAVDLERLWPGSTTAHGAPAGIVLLRRGTGTRSHLEPLDPANPEVREEWHGGAAGREAERQHYDRRLGALLWGVPVHRLTVGDDLDSALDLLETLLPR
jgi:hypothetical protein